MKTTKQPLAVARGPSSLARARFGPGMLLQHDDLEQLNTYTRELNRLMFSSLFGCGVVCGLVVSAKVDCGKVTVTVQRGLALDCQGDPIHVPQPQRLVLDEDCDPDMPSPLWVVLCKTEKCCAPRSSPCGADDDEASPVCTRARDYFEIRILAARPRCACPCFEPDLDPDPQDPPQALPDGPCRCADPQDQGHVDHYAGKCGCACADCAGCDCVLLARLDKSANRDHPEWMADHRVRRFVRPVLMRDPQAWIEQQARKQPNDQPAPREAKEGTDGRPEYDDKQYKDEKLEKQDSEQLSPKTSPVSSSRQRRPS